MNHFPKWHFEPNGIHRMARTFFGFDATGSFDIVIESGIIREPALRPCGRKFARDKVRRMIERITPEGVVKFSATSKRIDLRDRFAPAVIDALGAMSGTLTIDMQKGGIRNVRR